MADNDPLENLNPDSVNAMLNLFGGLLGIDPGDSNAASSDESAKAPDASEPTERVEPFRRPSERVVQRDSQAARRFIRDAIDEDLRNALAGLIGPDVPYSSLPLAVRRMAYAILEDADQALAWKEWTRVLLEASTSSAGIVVTSLPTPPAEPAGMRDACLSRMEKAPSKSERAAAGLLLFSIEWARMVREKAYITRRYR